jgi:hypothetical protein
VREADARRYADRVDPRVTYPYRLISLPAGRDVFVDGSAGSLVLFVADRELVGETSSRKRLKLVDDLFLVHFLALELDRRLLDHVVGGEDRRLGADGERDRVGRPRVDLDLGAVLLRR